MTTITEKESILLHMLQEEIGIELANRHVSVGKGYAIKNGYVNEIHLDNLGLENIPQALQNFEHLRSLSMSHNLIKDLDRLKGLHFLTSLTLDENEINDIRPLSNLAQLRSLSLSRNRIVDVSPLSNLKYIDTLALNANEISNIKPILSLTRLTFLALLGNLIDNIEGIGSLSKLSFFSLANNDLTDITPLTELKEIRELDLFLCTKINPQPLSALTDLIALTIGFSGINELDWIRPLKNLRRVGAIGNNIKDISPLFGLNFLEELDLRQNPIENVQGIESLKNLQDLDLSECPLVDWSTFPNMPQLKYLRLRDNKLTNIDFLKTMKGLRVLELSSNELHDVGSLSRLKNLEVVEISNNLIKKFPKWLLHSPMDLAVGNSPMGCDLDNNPIEDVPQMFLNKGKQEVGDYLKSLEHGAQPINEIKVILLGEGAAGKTSLVNFLEGKPFNKAQSQTHGINIAECVHVDGVRMKIWDFGGQDIMHHTHQLFLTQNSVYVLVLNAREENDAEKWLKLIKVFGGESPVIIVTNKIDENPSNHENIKHLTSKYPNLAGRYARISCETLEGLNDFRSLLEDTIRDLLHVRTLWGSSWLKVKDALERMRSGEELRDYIHYDRYEELCERAGVLKGHRETLIQWLHELGVVTYFPDAGLSETNVINPVWLTDAFYKIINARSVADNLGRFSLADLINILPAEKYPQHKYNFLLGLMTKFELCYRVDDQSFLIPDLLQKEEPNFPSQSGPVLRFRFRYTTLLPKAIFPKFMVRRHQEIVEDYRWRTGLIIEDPTFNSRALVRIDEEEKDIFIQVSGDEQRGYLASILSSFNNINALYEGLEIEELVPCNCRECRRSDKPYYHKYSLLKKLRNKNILTNLCEYSLDQVSINDLLGILIRPEEMQETIKKLMGTGAFAVKNYLETNRISSFVDGIKTLFSGVSYLLFEKSEKAYHLPFLLLLRAVLGNSVKGDEIQAKGRADVIVNLSDRIFIFEIKLDGSTKDAIDQIHTNKYYEPYLMDEKPIELVGINFSSVDRNIESYQYETLKRSTTK